MVKIALLLPHKDMLGIAEKVVQEQGIDVDYIKVIETVDAVNEARLAVENGARIIVARGYQAEIIKEYTHVPLVEIRLHAQEIGLLLKKAKSIVKKEHPHVGIVIFKNMVCNLTHMEELFDVKLSIGYMNRMEDAARELAELAKKQPDVIIGGDFICEEAQKMGFPAIYLQATGESIAEALQAAKKMAYTAETEQQNAAQFETVLDTSFNGIVKINAEGKIIVINKLVENLLGKNNEDVIGMEIPDIVPGIDMSAINSILQGEKDNYFTSVNLRKQAWMLMVASIQYDGKITGAILSLQKASDAVRKDSKSRKDMFLNGFVAQTTFQNIYSESSKMKRTLELAKKYALSDSPVLIYGEEGTEYYLIAEAIHNNSMRKSNPYVSVNTRGIEKDQQLAFFFGGESGSAGIEARKNGLLVKADHGTVFINGIEHLTLRVQYQIARTMMSQTITRTDAQPLDNLDVRIIASSKVNLLQMVNNGTFSEELYYLLQGLMIEVPSLNQRAEDLRYYFEKYLKFFSHKYNKYLVVTEGTWKKLEKLSWKGNLVQLKSFCERLVLTIDKRNIDEVCIQDLYSDLYPCFGEVHGEQKVVVYKSPEAVELNALLEKHNGNRALVAEELGISTTTLWRRMKKYGVEAKYK